MQIININGPVNSGKSTVSKILCQKIRKSVFIEVDDFDAHGKEFPESINERLDQLYKLLEQHIQEEKVDTVIFAYPMYQPTYGAVTALIANRAEFIVVTLCPSLESCLTNRGTRPLDEWELKRIPEMYAEGVPTFEKSDLFIDNSSISADETADEILKWIEKK